jgi:CheY-like chemotaxis protein
LFAVDIALSKPAGDRVPQAPEPYREAAEVGMTRGVSPVLFLVEDDRDIRNTLYDILSEEGYHIYAAADGKEALARLPALPRPCAVLLDLRMPEMDGWEFLAAAQRRGLLDGIPVVVFSAATPVALPPGATSWLKKPVELTALLAALAAHCQHARDSG